MRGYDQFAQGFFISLIFLFSMQYVVPENSVLHLYLMAAWVGFLGGVIFPDSDCYKNEYGKGSELFSWPQKHKQPWVDGLYQDPTKLKKRNEIEESNNFKLVLKRMAAIFVIPSMYFFRYAIYLPEVLILKLSLPKRNIINKHRYLAHSVFGTIVAAIIYGFYWLMLDVISILINLKMGVPLEKILAVMPHYDFMLMASVSFFVGTVIHISQDSIYKYPIRLFYPFSAYVIKGTSDFNYPIKPTSFLEAIRFNHKHAADVLITVIFSLISGLVMVYYPYILEQILKLTKNHWGVFSLTLLFDFMLVFLVYGVFFKVFRVKIEKEYP